MRRESSAQNWLDVVRSPVDGHDAAGGGDLGQCSVEGSQPEGGLNLTQWTRSSSGPSGLGLRHHAATVDELTAGHRARRARAEDHPVEDFLFTYYPFRLAALRRWHPGPGVLLLDAAGDDRAQWRHCATVGDDVRLDREAYLHRHEKLVRSVRDLLVATAGHPAQLACFGLHEWAMVYRLPAQQVRHGCWPLRLDTGHTDAVVEANELRCTHADAFRFFTDQARPRNALHPTRDQQQALEQPGCLHAGMDLCKWAMRLGPGVPGEVTLDCFRLARELRVLDMRASPYDLSALGYVPIPVETAAGRAEYVRLQRRYAEQGQALRLGLVAACETVLGADSELDANRARAAASA